jgi:hypothetical protein
MVTEYYPVVLAFVMLFILSKMVDKAVLFLEYILKYIPRLPDKIEAPIAYILVTGLSYIACWRFNFSIFSAFGYPTVDLYEGWIGTALVLSGGSKFMREISENLDYLPGFLSTIIQSTRQVLIRNNNKDADTNVIVAAQAESEMKAGDADKV